MRDELVNRYKNLGITQVVGIESRGFIIAPAVAMEIGAGFVPIRKPGKLPAETIQISYAKEYGLDTIQMHKDALNENDIVLIHDDILATGGSMAAAIELVKKTGVLPMAIIMVLQQETGTALVFAAFLLVFYRQGMSGMVLWGGILAAIIFIIVIRFSIWPAIALLTVCFGILAWRTWKIKRYYKWLVLLAFIVYIGFSAACDVVFTKVLQPHQRVRIEVLLGMKDDPSGAGYNVAQSMIAIGSGRFLHLYYVCSPTSHCLFCART